MALTVSYIPRVLECGTPNPRTRKSQTFVGFEKHPLGRIQLFLGEFLRWDSPGDTQDLSFLDQVLREPPEDLVENSKPEFPNP